MITGDHDRAGGGLDAFYAGLGGQRLPYAVDAEGVRCLFLDMCGPGAGGPDFRLGSDQIGWLEAELRAAEGRGQDCALFMHSDPADLKGEGEAARVAELIHRGPVRLVEMGHTHYNALANDGRTVYAAARSTGQIEEGPVGYAIAALDRGTVSWRFKDLARPRPFILITAPADRRLAHDAAQVVDGEVEIRALVLGAEGVAACAYSLDDGPWRPMVRVEAEHRYAVRIVWPAGARRLAVRAPDAAVREDIDRIEPPAGLCARPVSKGVGGDADAVGAWPARGILGSQRGPNRNGRPW